MASHIFQVCRYADGYQPHLVSPEKGIRALGIEALDQVEGPVKNCVQGVYNLLINAARCDLNGLSKTLRFRTLALNTYHHANASL